MTLPNFRLPRTHGQCPACDHAGEDCHCHRHPKKAAKAFARRQMEIASKAIATAQEITLEYNLKTDATTPVALQTEVGSSYLTSADRFVVFLIVGYGPDDGISTPKHAVGAALEFITANENASETHWHCLDRKTGILHVVKQDEAEIPSTWSKG